MLDLMQGNEKIRTIMSNEKKQTAVEWFSDKSWKLKVQIEKREISVGEYAVTYVQLLEQAKAMEKEQILHSYADGQADTLLMFKQKISKMKDIPSEFNQLISENFWDLV